MAAEPASSSSSRPLEYLARRNQELVNENHRLSEVLNAALAARLAEATGSKATGSEATGSEAPPPPGPRQLVPSAKVKLMGPYPSENSNVLPFKKQGCSKEERQKRDRKNRKEKKRQDKRDKWKQQEAEDDDWQWDWSWGSWHDRSDDRDNDPGGEALGPSVFEMEVGLELKLAKLA